MRPTRDDYGVLTTSDDTSCAIAYTLATLGHCVVGWTDESGTHYDITLSYNPIHIGRSNGNSLGRRLYVGIVGKRSFGFALEDRNAPLHETYVAEKLGLSSRSTTTVRLTMLLNGIVREIIKSLRKAAKEAV